MQFRDLKKQYETIKDDMDARIQAVIDSAAFISGKEVKELEQKLSKYVGVKHCITCGNGTDALTLALETWNVGQGDAVFVPDFTFFSSGECPAYEGATPIFVDVDNTYNISPERLEEAILKVKSEGKYNPRVVIAVDLFGQPADYPAIKEICKRHNLLLLEDGAQGFGGNINGKMACSFGDISTTSFFPAKPLGCYGDGGAIFTDNDEWATHLRSICVHGKNTTDLDDPNAKYNNIRLGMNSRLDTIQAAVLLSKLDLFKIVELDAINKVADMYGERLKETELELPIIKEGFYSSWAQYTIRIPLWVNRSELQAYLREYDIPTMIYYAKPMHRQLAFCGTDSSIAECPNTEKYCASVLSLPLHPYMTSEEVDLISTKIKEYLKKHKNV